MDQNTVITSSTNGRVTTYSIGGKVLGTSYALSGPTIEGKPKENENPPNEYVGDYCFLLDLKSKSAVEMSCLKKDYSQKSN